MKRLSLSSFIFASICGLGLALPPFGWAQPTAAAPAHTAWNPTVVDPTTPAHPGILTTSDPAKPPPFVDGTESLARQAAATDPATKAIPPGLRTKVDSDHAVWHRNRGGVAFRSHLSYFGGCPLLMLVTSSDEPGSVKARRYQAIVEACEVHLNDEAFDRTIICIAEVDSRQTSKVTTRNVEVRREAYQRAVKTVGKDSKQKSAMTAVRGDDSGRAFAQICSELGIR